MSHRAGGIRVGNREIGGGGICFIAAEVGINHNGDLELAKKLTVAAAEAGADAVKVQNYRTEDFLSDATLTYTYHSQGREITESQWDMFKRCELKPGWLQELKTLCDRLGLVFFSTPTSEQGVRELLEVGAPLLKNGSDYLTHTPLLEFMASTGVPVVVSTGMADQEDVDAAVAAVRRGARSELVLLHCTSSYPTAAADTNLRRMVSLRERYQVPVGFSDHTAGWLAAVQAVTLGACMIEKHFTLDRDLPGPDHWFSSTPEELRQLVAAVRQAEQTLGSAALEPTESERVARGQYRVTVVAARNLVSGSALAPDMVAYRRPGQGILPRELPRFLGRRLKRAIPQGAPLAPEDFN
jgi:N-acetylneuraminate synthase/N,N'-diacetyllegionaminate synthase